MDIETMHQNVKLELDKTSALELPAFEQEEIDFWLNSAIRKFVKTRYDGLNVKSTGFEQTQKRIDDLRALVVHYSDTNPSASTTFVASGGYSSDLPIEGSGLGSEDYWFTLAEEVNIIVDAVETRVGVVESTIDEYRSMLDNPFSEHILHYQTAKPIRIFSGNTVELISDSNYTIDDYHLTYLKSPDTVVYSTGTDCDLPEHTHDEVVKLAASMMLENIEQPRYQTHMNEVGTME